MTAVRDLAFNYYPLYLFLAVFVGLRSPGFLRKLVRLLAWFNGIYGVAYILFLNTVPWTIPGVSADVVAVPLFGEPFGSAIALLGLLAFEADLWSVWHLFLLMYCSSRKCKSEANGWLLGSGCCSGAGSRSASSSLRWRGRFSYSSSFLCLLWMSGFKDPKCGERGSSRRAISSAGLSLRCPDLAAEYTDNYQTASDTTLWRTIWWVRSLFPFTQLPRALSWVMVMDFPWAIWCHILKDSSSARPMTLSLRARLRRLARSRALFRISDCASEVIAEKLAADRTALWIFVLGRMFGARLLYSFLRNSLWGDSFLFDRWLRGRAGHVLTRCGGFGGAGFTVEGPTSE